MQNKPKPKGFREESHSCGSKCKKSAITDLQHELFNEGVVSRKLLDTVPNPLLIINEQWQVVYANPAVRALVDKDHENPVIGLSEGEAFHCVHARHSLQEAGKHECCRICGVARVLSLSLQGKAASEDCRLACELTGTASNLDLRVWATPLEFNGANFSILTLVDISDKYRREALEKICYHDLLNTLSSIKGFLSIMNEVKGEEHAEICELLERTTQSSIDEIIALRMIERADQNDLQVKIELLESSAFLDLMQKTLQRHPAASNKSLKMTDNVSRIFSSDPRLLRRIVSNMLINALEATPVGGSVSLSGTADDTQLCIQVHNDQPIPRLQCHQIFQQNSSSKGQGRGQGTYSIKLLSDILGGAVSFTSSEQEGTTFSLRIEHNNEQRS